MVNKNILNYLHISSSKLAYFTIIFLCAVVMLLIVTKVQSASKVTGSHGLIIAIPLGKTDDKLFSIYPLSVYTNNKYYENKTSIGDEKDKIFKDNQVAINLINRNNKFMAFSESEKIGMFVKEKISYIQGMSCDYTFSPIGKLRISNTSKQGERNIAVLISENDKTRTYDIDTNVRSVLKNKLYLSIVGNIKSFRLHIANVSWEFVKRIKVDSGNDLIIAMTKTTLSIPHVFYESAGQISTFQTLSIFQVKNGILYPLYFKNPDHVIYTEFIWAGDIEGDGNIEIVLREAYGEFGKFVIFRFQQDRLIKIFEGTEYGC